MRVESRTGGRGEVWRLECGAIIVRVVLRRHRPITAAEWQLPGPGQLEGVRGAGREDGRSAASVSLLVLWCAGWYLS